MSNALVVHKGRHNTVTISTGIDLSTDVVTSEIRAEPEQSSLLIATWTVTFTTDGSDGELILTMNETISGQVVAAGGYMDLKRLSGGLSLPVFAEPIEVEFQGTVTA